MPLSSEEIDQPPGYKWSHLGESYLLPSILALRTLIVDARAGYLYSRGRGLVRTAALQHENERRFESGISANRSRIQFFDRFEQNFAAIRCLYAKKR